VRRPGERWPCDDKKRSHKKEKPKRFWIGLDGEGVGREPHRYTLLAWSDATGERSAHIHDARGLSTRRCIEFLLSIPPEARIAGFYLHYDWTMILRDVANRALYELFRPELRARPKDEGGGFSPVKWRHYELDYLARRMRIRKRGKCIDVWDLGAFYQMPFVKMLETWNVGTQAERDLVTEMKEKRATFERETTEAQRREYCLLECKLLADAAEKLEVAHEKVGLPLRTFHGPGSTAGVALKRWGIKKKRGNIPRRVQDAALRAYFGGRFERREQKVTPLPWGVAYDIISAYPAATLTLPCLEHARWHWTEKESVALAAEQACVKFSLERTRNKRAWGPLPIRLANGNIVFPRSGARGWTWLEEYRVARKWSQVRFLGAWVLRRKCDCQPFAGTQELFDRRAEVGRKTGEGLTLKLCVNSLSGKLAQNSRNAPFHSRVWAGMITSDTRARILRVLVKHDAHVLAIATDGILADKDLELECGEGLGDWERTEFENLVMVRPGIYWTTDPKSKKKRVTVNSTKARGKPRKSVLRERKKILTAILRGDEQVTLKPIQQFGGAKACVYRTREAGIYRRAARYGEWFEQPAKIGLEPGPKRAANWKLWELPGVESMPYNRVGVREEKEE